MLSFFVFDKRNSVNTQLLFPLFFMNFEDGKVVVVVKQVRQHGPRVSYVDWPDRRSLGRRYHRRLMTSAPAPASGNL